MILELSDEECSAMIQAIDCCCIEEKRILGRIKKLLKNY